MSVQEAKKNKDRFNPVGETRPIKLAGFDPDHYVFISHPSSTDPDLLRAIVRSLLRRGISVWIFKAGACRLTDDELKGVRVQQNDPHVRWDKQVLDAVDAATIVLLLIGQKSIGNDYQAIEINRAIELKKFVAARVDDVDPKLMPAALQDDLTECLDPVGADPHVVSECIKHLCDKVGDRVFGETFKAPPRENPLVRLLRRLHPIVWAVAAIILLGLLAWGLLSSGNRSSVFDDGLCPDGQARYFGQCPPTPQPTGGQ